MAASLAWKLDDWNTGGLNLTQDPNPLRFKAAVDNNDNFNNPLVKPASGQFSYSYEKVLAIFITNTSYTQVSNLRFKLSQADLHATSGAVRCWYGFKAVGSFTEPVGTNSGVAGTGTEITSTNEIQWQKADGSTPSDTHVPANGSNVQWNNSRLLYLQLKLADTATGGNLGAGGNGWQTTAVWDEI